MTKVVSNEIMKRKKKKGYWVQYISQQIRKNKNWLQICSGATGSSKSWSMLEFADQLNMETRGELFDIKNCCFKAKNIMQRINSGELKKGSVLMWDEVGIDLSNRAWQSLQNKVINYLLQTFRHKNIILLFTCPYSDFVDLATRKLFHAEFRTLKIDFKKNEATLKPLLIQYNSRLGKFYWKRLKVITKKGNLPIDTIILKKPREDLIKEYEAKKTAFTDKLNISIEHSLEKLEEKDKPKYKCNHCGHKWVGRGLNEPTRCPECRRGDVAKT